MSIQELASSDPAADQQARADAAADASIIAEVGQLADGAASDRILALEQQVDELKTANESSVELINTLNEDKNALLLQVSERDETIASLTADKTDLAAQVQTLTSDLTAARAEFATGTHDEDRLHNLWCAAGGKLGDFEAAKRFVASL